MNLCTRCATSTTVKPNPNIQQGYCQGCGFGFHLDADKNFVNVTCCQYPSIQAALAAGEKVLRLDDPAAQVVPPERVVVAEVKMKPTVIPERFAVRVVPEVKTTTKPACTVCGAEVEGPTCSVCGWEHEVDETSASVDETSTPAVETAVATTSVPAVHKEVGAEALTSNAAVERLFTVIKTAGAAGIGKAAMLEGSGVPESEYAEAKAALLSSGRIRQEGNKRGAKYFAA